MTFCEGFAARLMLPAWPIAKKGDSCTPEVSQLVDLGLDPTPMPIPTGTMRAWVQLLDKLLFLPRVQTDHCLRSCLETRIEE